MKFSQDSLISGLRKREENARGATGPGPKRPCRREPGRSTQPPATLPEAILVEDGEGEENPPTGVPIDDAPQMSNGLFVLRDDLVSVKSQLSDAKARELKALDDLRAAQEVNRAWRERGEKELQVLDAKLSEVMARLLPTEEKLKETVLKLEHTENRADNAEAVARDAAEKLALAEKEAKEASDKLVAAEAKAQERTAVAEARARKAVEEYKSSPDFASELREAAMDAFVQGFERCKRRLSRHFKFKDLERFQPADDEEASDTKVEDPATKASDS